MTLDLSRKLPSGWMTDGFTEPRSDGVNWFRALESEGTLTLQARTPTFVTLRFQTYSSTGAYTLSATMNGRTLLEETAARADYHNAYVNLRLAPGASAVRFQVRCAGGASCLPVQVYHLSSQTVVARAVTASSLFLSVLLAILLMSAAAWFLLGRPKRSLDPSRG